MSQDPNIPASCLEPLSQALKRVFDDGKGALSNNSSVSGSAMLELCGCEQCSLGHISHDIDVIDGDKWEELVHGRNPDNSVDVVLNFGGCDGAGRTLLLPVEGKLGLAFRYPGDKRGSSLKLRSLEDKYAGLRMLLTDPAALMAKLVLLIPKDGQEYVWYLVRRWNSVRNSIGKVLSCCVNDFLRLFDLGGSERTGCCSADSYRIELLKSEFASTEPMSSVQLPSAGFCTGCRKCREACPRKAISIVPDVDHNGQIRPFVDMQSCKRNCRVCESVCPILHPERK